MTSRYAASRACSIVSQFDAPVSWSKSISVCEASFSAALSHAVNGDDGAYLASMSSRRLSMLEALVGRSEPSHCGVIDLNGEMVNA